MKKLAVILALLTWTYTTTAQRLSKFSSEPEEYLNDLESYLGDIDKNRAKEDVAFFAEYWLNTDYTGDQKTKIVELSNVMLKNRIRPYPGFGNLIYTLAFFAENSSSDQIDIWLNGMLEYADKSRGREIESVIEVSRTIAEDQSLYKSNALRWAFDLGSYRFDFTDGPALELVEVDIMCYSKGDSSRVYETSGRVDLENGVFKANGGTLFWDRAGFDRDSLYAELSSFEIVLKESGFIADTTVLHSLYYIAEPITGQLEEKIMAAANADNARYPQFRSYIGSFAIQDLVPDVNYQGGFSVEGSRFIGSGIEGKPAVMEFLYEGNRQLSLEANRFALDREGFKAGDVHAVIFLEEDSLSHPQLIAKFQNEERILTLLRDDEGLSQRPFVNSYHNVEMYFEQLTWDMDEAKMSMGNLLAKDIAPVYLESRKYFRDSRFEKLQGMDDVNPLFLIKKLDDSWENRNTYPVEEIAQYLQMSPHQCRVLMMNMTILGYVDYNIEKGIVKIERKLHDHVNARGGFIDYDVILFRSVVDKGDNAVLSLLNYDLKVNGVERVAVSDSQQVFMWPSDGVINMKQGLDFEYSGILQAGRFDFYGRLFYFDYEDFRVNMPTVDSMKFLVPSFETDDLGRRRLVLVKNFLSDMRGELFIDKPNNKSSRSRYPEYPIFKSATDSYVYWSDEKIHKGAYLEDRVYYHVRPFEIDSLDNFKTESLSFDGEFTSGNIFPEFEVKLKVQKDYSLGFKTTTPPGGFPLYGGKARYTNEIEMSNQGLRGDGIIEYITSTAVTHDVIFFLDSADAIAETWHVDEQRSGVEYPLVDVSNAKIHWLTVTDEMYVYNDKENPFTVFDFNASHRGEMKLTPSGLYGGGRTDFMNARTRSDYLTFESNRFYGDTMSFQLRLTEESEWAFELDSAYGDLDFDMRKGQFDLYNVKNPLDLALNRYQVFMDHVDWNMDEKNLDLYRNDSSQPADLLSVRPDQDSLQFQAFKAKYHLVDTLLEAFQAEKIEVADARILPDSQYVAIGPNANMYKLKNAQVVASRENEYHLFYESEIKVRSRNEYDGNGKIDYLDLDETAFPIVLDRIYVDDSLRTRAEGKVDPETEFFLSPFFSFSGKVFVRADSIHLNFDGKTEIQHSCETILTDAIPFSSYIDPNNIMIDLSRFEEMRRTKSLYSGLYFNESTGKLQSAFLSMLGANEDNAIFVGGGFLMYDMAETAYKIGNRERLTDPGADGNLLIFDNKDCAVYGDGKMMLSSEKSGFTMEFYGRYKHELYADTVTMEGTLVLDYPFATELTDIMTTYLNSETGISGADASSYYYQQALFSMVDKKEREKMEDDLANYGYLTTLPKSVNKTMVFSDVNMHWDTYASAFTSDGNLGLSLLHNSQVNKSLPGKFQLVKRRSGEEAFLYLEVDRKNWYYYHHRRNVLQTIAADEDYNNFIKELDIKKRQTELENGQYFQYTISTPRRMQQFVSQFENL